VRGVREPTVRRGMLLSIHFSRFPHLACCRPAADPALHRVELLSQIGTWTPRVDHLDDRGKMPIGSVEALGNVRMEWCCIPRGGCGKRSCGPPVPFHSTPTRNSPAHGSEAGTAVPSGNTRVTGIAGSLLSASRPLQDASRRGLVPPRALSLFDEVSSFRQELDHTADNQEDAGQDQQSGYQHQ
jgi:hypothetical protein